jgi:hypothetical protein
MAPFQELVQNFVEHAYDSGMRPPFTFVIVSVNGYVSAVRYRRTENAEWLSDLLVEGQEPRGVFPLNMCLFDVTGKIINAKVDDLPSGSGAVH